VVEAAFSDSDWYRWPTASFIATSVLPKHPEASISPVRIATQIHTGGEEGTVPGFISS
jgi:hypothetical protein